MFNDKVFTDCYSKKELNILNATLRNDNYTNEEKIR